MWKVDRKITVKVNDKDILVKIYYDDKLKTGWKKQRLIDSVFLRVPPDTSDEDIRKRLNTPFYKEWVKQVEKNKKLISKWDNSLEQLGFKLENRTEEELKEIIEKYVAKYEDEFIRPKISIRSINGVWGRCSKSKDKLTFNPVMKYISEEYIEFIVYHEMIHTYCLNHNPPFFRKMKERYPNYRQMDRELRMWEYLLEKNDIITITEK